MASGSFDAVVHFAGLKAVGESVERPLAYYRNNLNSTFSVLTAMGRHGVRTLVFSSSATVYGQNSPVPMNEALPTSATNPYGWTKVMQEQVFRDAAVADPSLRIALLRYFNPVGAHASGMIGEDPSGTPNNLMPILTQVAVGRREKVLVYGDDYPTPDGTGRRDYLHVEDLASGHVAALEKLGTTDAPVSTWNLGTGRPTSVMEMIHAFSLACGRDLPYEIAPRRPGDIAESYADPSRAHAELGWAAERGVDEMCADSWRWQSQNPEGYPDD
jgi:UDP-glucose 4-epimerase